VPEPSSFDYAIVRVVPHVERGECLNAGVILFCRTREFLGARIHLDPARLHALCPGADADAISAHLESFAAVAAGGERAGPIGKLSPSERFHWLTSPRSTVVQVGEVHSGLSDDPARSLDELFDRLAAHHDDIGRPHPERSRRGRTQ